MEHDLIIIGSGLAGLRAAVEANTMGLNVAVVSKVHAVRSHSNAAQGGINAPLTDRGEDWKGHALDTIKGSDYLADQDAVALMSQEAGEVVLELENMGVIFSRGDDGRLGTRRFGGQKKARTYFVGAITGSAILHVLYEQALKHGLTVYEEWFVTSLVKEDGVVKGVVALDMKTGELHLIKGKAVIMASGGAGRIFEPSTNALICTGDGLSLAWRAGAPLMDMEMIQFHPTTLAGNGILLSEAARGEGAYLLNSKGERFMETYAPDYKELASRDVVSRAEQTEINEGRGIDGNVLLDLRHLGKKFIEERLGYLQEVGTEFLGIDLSEKPIPIRPGMHYIMGGIKTDANGVTEVPGLYAVGECANVSVHGANRLGANSLLDTIVFGRRSARHIADYIGKNQSPALAKPDEYLEQERKRIAGIWERKGKRRSAAIRSEMAENMTKYLSVFRDDSSIKTALKKVEEMRKEFEKNVYVENKKRVFNTDLIFALELDFMIDVALTMCVGADMRKESRGAHYRTDMPERNDEEWLKHTLIYRADAGYRVDTLPVVITDWKPVARKY